MKVKLGNAIESMNKMGQEIEEQKQENTAADSARPPLFSSYLADDTEAAPPQSEEKTAEIEKNYFGSKERLSRQKKYFKKPTCREEIRPTIAKIYDAGRIPLIHLQYYRAIVKALRGKMEGDIKSGDIRDALGMSQQGKLSAQGALEVYGYMITEYVNGMPRFGTHVKLLKDPQEILGDDMPRF